MKNWQLKAQSLLEASLTPPKHELNELDWKAGVSPDKRRLIEHLSAFSNLAGGGFLIYGLDNEGVPQGMDGPAIEKAVNQLANLGRDALEPPIILDHAVIHLEGVPLLCIHIPESPTKPVHLRGKPMDQAFIRSGATTSTTSAAPTKPGKSASSTKNAPA